MMSRDIKILSIGAMFSALIFTATFIAIPLSNYGNVNFGDSMVFICSMVMGYYGILPSCIGASLCDALSGYSIYAPGTFLIKGIMSFLLVFFIRIFKEFKVSIVFSMFMSECVMVVGYLLYELIIFGSGAVSNVPFNILQGIVNILISIALYRFIHRLKINL